MVKTISISILDSDPLNIEKTLNSLDTLNIKNIHLDIMDTSFVNNISFGINTINKILDFDFVFDVHLMVSKPNIVARKLNLERVDRLIYHAEITQEEKNKLNFDVKKGIAINPGTSIFLDNKIDPKIINEEFVLVMTVEPGLGGQSFKTECIDKIDLQSKIVGVDGGINLDTIKLVKNADFFVIGSAFFKANDKENFIRQVYEIIDE